MSNETKLFSETGKFDASHSTEDHSWIQEEKMEGEIPGTIKKQNLGHNSKKEGLSRNTKR
ncbi:hypothetical protein [Clostridium aminobutyricum]|uniref:Uncharacterized protein n=1 Tax=Clostridium aminobutyricum TaxID=33953 RepID=A0A939IIV2_CLOAM|nr:hypothetical protein [Clostridium aminobutyricum]MBN7773456.1 hypothetical protein [Clostridium aminobutyricum]